MEAARISSPGTVCFTSEDGRWKSDENRWKIVHRLSVKDRTTGSTIQGNGLCFITESANSLIGVMCPAFSVPAAGQKYNCRLVAEGGSKREVFKCKLGRCTKTKAKLVLRDNAIPVFKKKCPVPYASVTDLDKEIDQLVAEGVIPAVDHSEWVAPVVVVRKKNGNIRLCADISTGLNDALQLHQHPVPTAEEVFTKLNGGQLFTQIDFTEAYLQVEVGGDADD
ncbi:hypothetical protein OESDEN_13508 [Oesophagostomum dentatum]|uniref:Reverse transcriptase domain-containing protein n=1 Tax=Oesophagostomum dentatum TaxID=61180 RepID=A0A0B1SN42_OESDE|nr:hypothetical protein OESDEN_13508 [Oesophagostomum dentatum]